MATADELRGAIRALHAAGIEVILDVVYNHTCEGSELGPTLSWRGFDNASYYRLLDDDPRHWSNDTGTGNTLNSQPSARPPDGDGFAALLGAVLPCRRLPLRSRRDAGPRASRASIRGCGFFDALRQDPVLAGVKLISEPWDIGPGGYQLGNHPPASRNGTTAIATRCAATGAAIRTCGRSLRSACPARPISSRCARPSASINYVASHDGATLGRPHDVRGQAQRGQRRGQSRRHLGQSRAQLGRGRADRRRRSSRPCARACAARCWRRCSGRSARRCCSPATSSAARRRATTTPIARTTRSPGSTGPRPITALIGWTARLIALRRDVRGLCARTVPARQGDRAGLSRSRLARRTRRGALGRRLAESRRSRVGDAPHVPARRRQGRDHRAADEQRRGRARIRAAGRSHLAR